MTSTRTSLPLQPGDSVHFFGSVTVMVDPTRVIPISTVTEHGQVGTLTSTIIESNSELFALIDDPEAQLARWGQVMIGRGPWPEGVSKFVKNSPQAADERDRRLREAARIEDPRERRRVRAQIIEELGDPAAGQMIAEYTGDDGRDRLGRVRHDPIEGL